MVYALPGDSSQENLRRLVDHQDPKPPILLFQLLEPAQFGKAHPPYRLANDGRTVPILRDYGTPSTPVRPSTCHKMRMIRSFLNRLPFLRESSFHHALTASLTWTGTTFGDTPLPSKREPQMNTDTSDMASSLCIGVRRAHHKKTPGRKLPGVQKIVPATSYSPTGLPPQYHGR